jgi:hypothetical protein
VVVGSWCGGSRADSNPSTTTAVGVGSSGCSDSTSGGGCGSWWKGLTAIPSTTTAMGVGSNGCSDSTSGGGCGSWLSNGRSGASS